MISKHLFTKVRTFSRMGEFIQKVNPLTGNSEWIIQANNYDYHQEVARAAYADMLHDTERNEMYEEALKVAIEHMHKLGKKANVLDIGTGTGLLSMMAVRHGADTVYACEAFKPMGNCALEVIKLNGYESKITVIPKRSTELKIGEDLPFRANILVTEVFDTELIGEGGLGTFKHAHEQLLEADCIVVPHSGTIYAQIVESRLLRVWNRIKDIYDDEGELLIKVPQSIKECQGTAVLHDLQLSEITYDSFRSLAEPQSVLRFDFSGKTPCVMERSTISTVKSKCDGTAMGVFMWWDLNMDINNKIILSCAPKWAHPAKEDAPWRDHWMQAIYYFPKEIQMRSGEEMHLLSCHDEYSLWFNLKKNLKLEPVDYECPKCDCNLHLSFARTRIGQLNDNIKNKKYLRVIEENVTANTTVLVLSHGFYQSLAAAKLAKKVYIFESNHLSRRFINDVIRANRLENVEIIDSIESFKPELAIDLVLSEPYFITSILPWDNLHLLHLLKQFKPFLAEHVKIYPQQAIIKAVAVQFDHLHKIRSSLGSCQSFLMKPFDELIETSSEKSDDCVEAQPLWEYPGKALSDVNEIATINLSSDNIACERLGTMEINGESCNGIAIWVDWMLDVSSSKSVISTGPTIPIEMGTYITWDRYTRQGVCLLGDKNVGNAINYEFTYKVDESAIQFKVKL